VSVLAVEVVGQQGDLGLAARAEVRVGTAGQAHGDVVVGLGLPWAYRASIIPRDQVSQGNPRRVDGDRVRA
jgi:hypothetical protein